MEQIEVILLSIMIILLVSREIRDWRKSYPTNKPTKEIPDTPQEIKSLPPTYPVEQGEPYSSKEEEGKVTWAMEIEGEEERESVEEREWRVEQENEKKRGRR